MLCSQNLWGNEITRSSGQLSSFFFSVLQVQTNHRGLNVLWLLLLLQHILEVKCQQREEARSFHNYFWVNFMFLLHFLTHWGVSIWSRSQKHVDGLLGLLESSASHYKLTGFTLRSNSRLRLVSFLVNLILQQSEPQQRTPCLSISTLKRTGRRHCTSVPP